LNDSVPRTITQSFSVHEDDQIQVDLRCMENKMQKMKEVELTDCTEVGQAVLPFDRPLKKGAPVEITFALGADGVLTVHGRELSTGRAIDAIFKTEAVMTREEIQKAKSRNIRMSVS
jgi:molecular chaperone DnaK